MVFVWGESKLSSFRETRADICSHCCSRLREEVAEVCWEGLVRGPSRIVPIACTRLGTF